MTYYISLLEPTFSGHSASTLEVEHLIANSADEALMLTSIKRSKGQVLWARDSLTHRIESMAFIPNVCGLTEEWYRLCPVTTVEFS